jgi:hypothetical protein
MKEFAVSKDGMEMFASWIWLPGKMDALPSPAERLCHHALPSAH